MWKFAPVVKVGRGYSPALVVIDGVPVQPDGGTFYIEWWEGKRRVQKAVGKYWRDVLESARLQKKRLELKAAGIESDPIAQLADKGKTLASSIEYYVEHNTAAEEVQAQVS